MRELILIRHGLTTWNQKRHLQGHTDVPLSEVGRWQAMQLGRRFASEPLPDAVYSSDLSRARETAEQLVAGRGIEIRLEPALRERCFGIYEGRLWDEVQAHLEREARETGIHPDDFKPPRGESRREVQARVLAFFAGLEAAHPDGRVWVVSHGGIIRMLLQHLLGERGARFASGYAVFNTSVNHIRRGHGPWEAVRLNCAAHLKDGAPPTLEVEKIEVISEF